jgi:hypothetical protein
MNTTKTSFLALVSLTLLFVIGSPAQDRPYSISDSRIQTVLDRLNDRTVTFRAEMDRQLTGISRQGVIGVRVADFQTAVNRLRSDFAFRRSTTTDVQNLLDRARAVDRFMRNNQVSLRAADQWTRIRADLDTLAGYYRMSTTWTTVGVITDTSPAAAVGYYGTSAQMQALLSQLRLHNTAFRQSFDRWVLYNRNNSTWSTNNIAQYMTQFDQALASLNRSYSVGIDAVLRPASRINSFIATNRMSYDVTNRWNLVRTDLDTLASYYRINWDWNNVDNTIGPVGNTFNDFDTKITGTYALNESRSDNVTTVIDQAMRNVSFDATTRDRAMRMLERRLRSPQTLTIEKVGQQITMSSENAPAVTLVADGVVRTETSPRGRIVRTSVTATGNTLTINYEGDRTNDYYVTFRPVGTSELRVTRRIYIENQNQTVTVTSVYDKTSSTPEWNTSPSYPVDTGSVGEYVIPNNTAIVATLDTPLSTSTVRDGDRFSMTVTSPYQYSGAVIEGRAFGQRSGTITGRANMSMSFDMIRLRDGQAYKFAGIVEQVREPDGDIVTVNNEGTIRDTSQTNRTVTRAGAGALFGAIIGAIAGGGEGAAIGAAIGAGAGAGSVILQGRNNLTLVSGTQFTITATAPANVVP